MSSHGELPDHCKFGHVFQVLNEDKEVMDSGEDELVDKIRNGEIEDLEDVHDVTGTYLLRPIMGDHYKKVKVSAGSQGTPYTFILVAADDWDEKLDFEVHKTMERIHISPQNTMHDEFMQRKRQAEQRVNQTLGSLSDLRKQKHMLEHDIRKLRSRVESIREGDETQLKADFVELVDSAGGGQQGAAPGSLDFLRNNNIYPSIVADFNEMDSVEDLEGDGKLAELPENEKAILKKKYTMYEKWKDLYGSEIQRKLNELKSQLRNIERSIDETQDWLAPYVKDITMINQKSQEDLGDEISKYMTFTGYASQFKDMEFINYKPLIMEHGHLKEEGATEDNATHFKIMYMHCVHVNIAGGENPNSPAQGPTAGVVFWFPAIVCRHVFENIFEQKIEKSKDEFEQMMDDYTGSWESKGGEELKDAREDKNISIRKLREKVGEELGETVPIEFSAAIRRIEDGFESVDHIKKEYSDEYLEAVNKILDTEFGQQNGDKKSKYPLTGFNAKIQEFTGQYDRFYIPDELEPMDDFQIEFKFEYYYDLKLGMGLHTMK